MNLDDLQAIPAELLAKINFDQAKLFRLVVLQFIEVQASLATQNGLLLRILAKQGEDPKQLESDFETTYRRHFDVIQKTLIEFLDRISKSE